jgi:coproporphyrinogen III oxidase
VEIEDRAREFFSELQREICAAIEALEPHSRFGEDRWTGGLTRVLSGGRVFEKAGVSLADVEGGLSAKLAAHLEVSVQRFHATGISLVIHPLSPLVPAVHMNLRLVQLLGVRDAARPRDGSTWFGGGSDLTPCYLFEEDARHFHGVWSAVCERYEPGAYARFKKACDEYFRLPHRDEARGVGGIFFDYLGGDVERLWSFVRQVGGGFLEAYLPIVERRRALPWSDRERQWQLFGLETGGRTESILMSLPPLVRWAYDHRPSPGSPEAALVEVLRTPREW